MKKRLKIKRSTAIGIVLSGMVLLIGYIIHYQYMKVIDQKFFMSLCKDKKKMANFNGKDVRFLTDYLGTPSKRSKEDLRKDSSFIIYNEQPPELKVYIDHGKVLGMKCNY